MDNEIKKNLIPRASSSKRIAWLHSHFLVWTGGAKFVYEVAKRLNETMPVDIIVEQCSPEIREMYIAEDIGVIEINNLSSPSHWYWLFFPYYLLKDIRKIAAIRNRYCYFISSIFPFNFVAFAAGIKKYLVYVFEPFAFFHDRHMIDGFPMFERLCLTVLALCYRWLDIIGIRKATKIMTINDTTARWVNAIYGCEAIPSRLGVDSEQFSPKFNHLKDQYAGRKIVIHSTDFTPLKRTWDAVKAIENIRDEVPEVLLLITCTIENQGAIDELKKYLRENSLENHIEILGHLDHNELVYYYSLADISLYVGIGRGASAASLFVLECMACETPGIRTNFTHDEIEHGVSGFLYKPGDEAALRKHLIELLTNETLREKFGKAARQRVLEQYQWDLVTESFLETLQEFDKTQGKRL